MSQRPPRVTPSEAQQLIADGAVLVDTREQHEWDAGHVAGATLLPPATVLERIAQVAPDKTKPVVVYLRRRRAVVCAPRSRWPRWATSDVVSVAGGIGISGRHEGRRRAGRRHAIAGSREIRATPATWSCPRSGPKGQAKLAQSKVLFIGAGGLGSPGLLYLAAAGVGTLGIVDFDVVDVTNLQRQVIHADDRVGMKKTAVRRADDQGPQPEVNVIAHDEMLTDENVDRLIAGYDVVIDGTDTFETRYTLNDAAVRAAIPVIHASVFRFEGQLTVFVPYQGPCYRCLYPTPPPPELAPGCSVAGVFGVVPGVMGLLQATEAIKVLLKLGDPLVGRLLDLGRP